MTHSAEAVTKLKDFSVTSLDSIALIIYWSEPRATRLKNSTTVSVFKGDSVCLLFWVFDDALMLTAPLHQPRGLYVRVVFRSHGKQIENGLGKKTTSF